MLVLPLALTWFLVGTVSISKSEVFSKFLKQAGVPHEVLNAKNHLREADIIAQAGRRGAVTISTNMAGRGTDILLGGNPEAMAREALMEEKAKLAPTVEESDRALNELVFLQRMYDAGARGAFDVLAVQAYGLRSGPDDRRLASGDVNFSRTLVVRELMVKNGDAARPIWATEVGWNAPPAGYTGPVPYGAVNEELQATVEELNTTNDDLQSRSTELQDLAASLESQRIDSEQARARLEAILANMGDAVLVFDPNGAQVLTNAAYDQTFGAPDLVLEDEQGEPLSPESTLEAMAARGEPFTRWPASQARRCTTSEALFP